MDCDKVNNFLHIIPRLKKIVESNIALGKCMYKNLGIDIEPNWFVVLQLLQKAKYLSIAEIAEGMGFAHPTVIAIVNKMCERGYLDEFTDPQDSRKRLFTLGTQFLEQKDKLESIWQCGAKSIQELFADTNIFEILDIVESRSKQKNFQHLTLKNVVKAYGIEIVTYKSKYAKDFKELNEQWIRQFFKLEKLDTKILNHPAKEIVDKGGEIFFAKIFEQVIGTAAMIKQSDGSFELGKMAVKPDFHGMNIGYDLLSQCIEFGKMQSASNIWLLSNRKLASAIKLYEKRGFVEVPIDRQKNYHRADIKMQLIL